MRAVCISLYISSGFGRLCACMRVVSSKMRPRCPSKAFGSNQLRQRVIKIYDSPSDAHHNPCSLSSPAVPQPSPVGPTPPSLSVQRVIECPTRELSTPFWHSRWQLCGLCVPPAPPQPPQPPASRQALLPPVLPSKGCRCLKSGMWDGENFLEGVSSPDVTFGYLTVFSGIKAMT